MALTQCDLGITDVDFALPETGAGLLSSENLGQFPVTAQHLALVHPDAPVLICMKSSPGEAKRYLIRSLAPAGLDIELTRRLAYTGQFLMLGV
jgi:hypothetical protein